MTTRKSKINVLFGDDTNQTLTGTSGSDIVFAFGGDDVVVLGGGYDIGFGGAGIDTISYASAKGAVVVSLADNYAAESKFTRAGTTVGSGNLAGATYDLLFEFENIVGSKFGDVLIGSDGDNKISGGAGADDLFGGLGNDVLTGGTGADAFHIAGLNEGVDLVTDFVSEIDDLFFNIEVFSEESGIQLFGSGDQVASAFFFTEDPISDIYFSTTGREADAVLIARVNGVIDASDFQFYVPSAEFYA